MLAVTLIAIVMVVIVVVLALLRAKHRDGQPSHQAGAYEIGGDRIIGHTIRPRLRGEPCIGPLPSMPTTPSAMTKRAGTAALISRMLRSMPFQRRSELSCSTSAPTAAPGQR